MDKQRKEQVQRAAMYFTGWALIGAGVAFWDYSGAIPLFLGVGAVADSVLPDFQGLFRK